MRPQRDEAWILASESPRRIEMLRAAGQRFRVEPSGADEVRRRGEAPDAFAARVALDKARAVAPRHPGRWVLAADTIVIVDGETLGKPRDGGEAGEMLRRLSGRAHTVVTAFALLDDAGNLFDQGRVATRVVFRRLEEDEIRAYVAGGEPLDKAGAYGLQGEGARFVAAIEGSRSNVVGLPLEEVREMLEAAGLWTEAR